MKKRNQIIIYVLIALVVLISSTYKKNQNVKKTSVNFCLLHHKEYWDYKKPTWYRFKPSDLVLCQNGHHQSPINIIPGLIAEYDNLMPVYKDSVLDIVDNELTIQIDYEKGSHLKFDGVDYALDQFHFHTPSEHHISGETSPMEMHLVHTSSEGQHLVLGMLIKEGAENAFIEELWHHLPHDKDHHHVFPDEKINVANVLPANKTVYYYEGSLTTPPCTEHVKWLILKDTIEMSIDQLGYFHKYYNWNSRKVHKA